MWRKREAYNRLWIAGVKDSMTTPWDKVVLDAIRKEQSDKPIPDVMYVGNEAEYALFAHEVPHVEVCSRTTQNFPFLSGNMVRDMIMLHDERWKSLGLLKISI